jgi:hypothetical protein
VEVDLIARFVGEAIRITLDGRGWLGVHSGNLATRSVVKSYGCMFRHIGAAIGDDPA